jgi:hypothetical protein
VYKKVLNYLIPQSVTNYINIINQKKEFKKWEQNGCPVPPPHLVKQMTIAEYQQKYNISILVETGTFLGDMVEAQKRRFNQIFSIELGVDLYRNTLKRFRRNEHIKILLGDSGKVLPDILSEINEPAIFWLDGHYSAGITAKGDKDCPIYEELNAIFNSKKFNHILLIDDARCFNGEGDYPTIEDLSSFINSRDKNYTVEIKNDIIRYISNP